jgi:2',3'-cyclic-nucleotide 2'-phosphodiesterase (5'-nucleotidase family)
MNDSFFRIVLFFTCSFIFSVNAQNNNYGYHYELIKMDSMQVQKADLTIETYMAHLKQEKDKKMDKIIGVSKEVLISFSPASPLSNLLVDMLFEWGNGYLSQKKLGQADLALLNFGGIRAALPKGNITIGDIYQISPFDNSVAFVWAKGDELKKMFEAFTEKRNAPMANVQTVYRTGSIVSYTVGGAPLDPDRIYTIVTINFLATGGDEFLKPVTSKSIIYLDIPLRDVFIEEFLKKSAQNIEIESTKDDRVNIMPTP